MLGHDVGLLDKMFQVLGRREGLVSTSPSHSMSRCTIELAFRIDTEDLDPYGVIARAAR